MFDSPNYGEGSQIRCAMNSSDRLTNAAVYLQFGTNTAILLIVEAIRSENEANNFHARVPKSSCDVMSDTERRDKLSSLG
jgi:hypothetical protein